MPFRRVIVFALHLLLAAAAFTVAFLLRFDFDPSQIPDHHEVGILDYLPPCHRFKVNCPAIF